VEMVALAAVPAAAMAVVEAAVEVGRAAGGRIHREVLA